MYSEYIFHQWIHTQIEIIKNTYNNNETENRIHALIKINSPRI